jgi:hypothetical protein
MFYVLVFSLLAVVLVVAALTTRSRRRKNLETGEIHATSGAGHGSRATHGTHRDAAGRRNRKAKRVQSQHDRRKRH